MRQLRVQVIGLGVVGSAQAYLMSKLGHRVFGYDIDHSVYERVYNLVKDIVLLDEIETNADITLICVPKDEVEKVVKQLVERDVKGIYVIKSTLPVGTTVMLMKKYGVHILHNPEFLREKYALEDVMNPSRIVIGECCKAHGNLLEELYKPLNRPIYRTDPTTSELIKLVSNALRAMMISFWNTIYLLSERTGANIDIIAEAADPGKVIGEWEGGKWGTKYFARPYGGKCFPKDIKFLINVFQEHEINPALLKATEEINELFKRLTNEKQIIGV